MSYILEALRRADAERERGAVPGLHAQPVVPAGVTARRAPAPWAWAAGGAAVVIAAGLAWQFLRPDPSSPPAGGAVPAPARATAGPTAGSVATVAGAAVTAGHVGTAPPAAAPGPAPVRTAPPATPRPAPAAPSATRVAAGPANAAGSRSEAGAAPRGVAPAAPPRPAGPAAPESALPERIYAEHELPPEIRRELPPIEVSGSMYSPDPVKRFIVVDGQLRRESDEIAPGVTLERITLGGAVLKYKDIRYRIRF